MVAVEVEVLPPLLAIFIIALLLLLLLLPVLVPPLPLVIDDADWGRRG